MQITIEGRVKRISEVETAKSGKFAKRTVWVDIDQDTNYPQTIAVDFVQKSMERLNLVDEGDNVLIQADLRGREWEGRVFNSLNGWKCVIEAPKIEARSVVEEEEPQAQMAMEMDEEDDDDFDEENLPF